MTRIRATSSHVLMAIAEGMLIALLAVALVAGTVVAARGGHGDKSSGGSSLAVVALNSADGLPHQGGKIHFDVTTSATYPVVSVTCSQNGVVVYGASLPYYWPNPWDSDGTFILSSTAWTSGAADCKAALKTTSKNRIVTLATTSFHVYP